MLEEKSEQPVATIAEVRIAEIMQMLPHRYPFLLVDRMKNVVPGVSGIGIKYV